MKTSVDLRTAEGQEGDWQTGRREDAAHRDCLLPCACAGCREHLGGMGGSGPP